MNLVTMQPSTRNECGLPRQQGRMGKSLAAILLVTCVSMIIYAMLMRLCAPEMSSSECHAVTILFTSTLSPVIAFFVFRKQARLFAQVERELAVRRLTERSLVEAKEAAEKASQVQSEFLASMRQEASARLGNFTHLPEVYSRLEREIDLLQDALAACTKR